MTLDQVISGFAVRLVDFLMMGGEVYYSALFFMSSLMCVIWQILSSCLHGSLWVASCSLVCLLTCMASCIMGKSFSGGSTLQCSPCGSSDESRRVRLWPCLRLWKYPCRWHTLCALCGTSLAQKVDRRRHHASSQCSQLAISAQRLCLSWANFCYQTRHCCLSWLLLYNGKDSHDSEARIARCTLHGTAACTLSWSLKAQARQIWSSMSFTRCLTASKNPYNTLILLSSLAASWRKRATNRVYFPLFCSSHDWRE